MDPRYRISIIFAGILFFASISMPSFAQIDNIGELIRTGRADAEKLTRAYLEPLPSGFGADINSGWFMNAKPHKKFGFDLQIRGAIALVPSGDQSFDVTELGLENVRLADGETNSISPTIAGEDNEGPRIVIEDEDGDQLEEFNLPSGTGYNLVPAPMLQASVGLVKDTDITARFIPQSKTDDIEYGMLGFGVKHGINQWLPGGNLLPVDLSIMAGYTNIDITGNIDEQPDSDAAPNPFSQEAITADFQNQEAKISLSTFTIKALVGKSLPFISLYGGVGYETSTLDVDVVGDYPITVDTGTPGKFYDVFSDPIGYEEDGKNKMSLLAGANLKLLFFNIFAEYTLADYSVFNAGIGFSFR